MDEDATSAQPDAGGVRPDPPSAADAEGNVPEAGPQGLIGPGDTPAVPRPASTVILLRRGGRVDAVIAGGQLDAAAALRRLGRLRPR